MGGGGIQVQPAPNLILSGGRVSAGNLGVPPAPPVSSNPKCLDDHPDHLCTAVLHISS